MNKWPERQNHFSRCWGAFWSLVEHLLWVERCPYGVSQHSVPLQWAHNVFNHGLIYWKWSEHWLMFMTMLVFQVLKSLVVPGITYSTGGQVSGWSQSALYATAVGSESVYSWFYPEKLPEHWLAFMAKPFYLVSRSLLVCGRASPMDVNVSKWSQSALLRIAVGLESAYSWFDWCGVNLQNIDFPA